MSLRDWFEKKRHDGQKDKLDPKAVNNRLSDDELCRLWTSCFSCNTQLPTKEVIANLMVCTQCGYHFRIGAKERIEQLTSGENDWFVETDAGLIPQDPLEFTDTKPYVERQKAARKKANLNDAIVTGVAKISEEAVAIGVMDFSYLGGSMGSVVGEKVTRLVELALEYELPVILFTSSGGARMQEGTFSLMQMAKSGAILGKLHEAGLFYMTVLCEPTFGGVTASFGMLGDVNIAEQSSRIGFAGRRVIEQTIRQKLPSDFQTAEYLLKYGQVDRVEARKNLRKTIVDLVRIHRVSAGKSPKVKQLQKERFSQLKTPEKIPVS